MQYLHWYNVFHDTLFNEISFNHRIFLLQMSMIRTFKNTGEEFQIKSLKSLK